MDGTCDHSDVCGRDALDGHDGNCILHSENPEKDEEAFEQALEDHREEHGPDFRRMVFPTVIDFSEATFKALATFRGATFKAEASFCFATFEVEAIFHNATFDADVNFGNATFGEDALFQNATFETKAIFSGATFESGAVFDRAFVTQRDDPSFVGQFQGCDFNGDVLFSGGSVESRVFAGGRVDFTDTKVAPGASLRFRYADLSRCHFLRTDLRDVEFTGIKWCDDFSVEEWFSLDWFRGKEWFRRVGLYDEVVEIQKRRSFCDIVYTTIDRMGSPNGPHWTLFEVEDEPEDTVVERWGEVERLYRQLKRNHEERGDFPRGGDFHIGEKEARRKNPRTNAPLKLLLYAYRAASKYGERALPAAFCLLALVFGCAGLYDAFGASLADPRAAQALGLDSGDPLSFGGALRTSLEASFYPLRAAGFEELGSYLLNVAQRVISPVLIALFALALRQRVKR